MPLRQHIAALEQEIYWQDEHMKLTCRCGHIIVDQTDDLTYKGWVTRDKHDHRAIDAAQSIAAFFRACAEGTRRQWLQERFSPEYPQELNDEAVVNDLLSIAVDSVRLGVYECLQCGRLWLQNRRQPDWLSFVPEDKVRHVLDVAVEDTA